MHSFNKIELSDDICIYEDFSDNNEALTDLLSSIDLPWNLATPTEALGIKEKLYKELSRSSYILSPFSIQDKRLVKYLSMLFPSAIACIKDFAIDKQIFTWYNDIEVLKYEKGQYMNEHYDSALNEKIKFSVFYYLNDDYEGGEIVFVHKGISVKPKKNSVLIFSSNSSNAHKVNPVLSGTKYVVTTFLL